MAASMRAALVRCGLNQTTANYAMTDQGFDSAEELATHGIERKLSSHPHQMLRFRPPRLGA